MRFDILTIFPQLFAGIFDNGILKRAIATRLVDVKTHDLRDFTHDRHRTVDDRPFGGGEGMVLKPEPIALALDSIQTTPRSQRNPARETVILLSAQGRPFTQATARELASLSQITLICGRYEGVDERVNRLFVDREVSIGDYVLSGGELAAAVILDATMRLLPGVLGNEASSQFESFGQSESTLGRHDRLEGPSPPRSTHGAGGLLDYPHYTRPAEFQGLAVPEILTGGDHECIKQWRREQALAKTLQNRPDLLARADLTDRDREFLAKLGHTES